MTVTGNINNPILREILGTVCQSTHMIMTGNINNPIHWEILGIECQSMHMIVTGNIKQSNTLGNIRDSMSIHAHDSDWKY